MSAARTERAWMVSSCATSPGTAMNVSRPVARRIRQDAGAYSYDELALRDKLTTCLKDEALEESANLPAPVIIAAEIVEDLRAALSEFEQLEASRRANAA